MPKVAVYNSVKCPTCGRANQIMVENKLVIVCKHCRSEIKISGTSEKKRAKSI